VKHGVRKYYVAGYTPRLRVISHHFGVYLLLAIKKIMHRFIKNKIVILCLLLIISGCTTNQKNTYSEEKVIVDRVSYYNKEARLSREAGNEQMARYFESKAEETIEDIDYGPIDFIFDLIFP